MRHAIWGLLIATILGCTAPGTTRTPVPDAEVARGAAPEKEIDHLALAARFLDEGDSTGALQHLRIYVDAHPEAIMVRSYLAELHYKLGQLEEARVHFHRFVTTSSGQTGNVQKHLVHVHTRLMEIAASRDDSFAEHLHRGIGLVLLVQQWDAEKSVDDEAVTEVTLVRAASALKTAREIDATDPRVHLYLAEAWGRLGQHSAAQEAMTIAREHLPDAGLTADEVRRIRNSK